MAKMPRGTNVSQETYDEIMGVYRLPDGRLEFTQEDLLDVLRLTNWQPPDDDTPKNKPQKPKLPSGGKGKTVKVAIVS